MVSLMASGVSAADSSSPKNGRMPRAYSMSELEVPAAIIGHTCASSPTTNSTTTGRSLISRARCIASSTSSAEVTRNDTAPSASDNFTKSGT